MKKDYRDIINLPHHESPTRNRMSLNNRAAQFTPFAALTGYDAAIIEAGRITKQKPILTEESKIMINEKLVYLTKNKNTEAEFIYFIKDPKKSGGTINSIFGMIKKIDEIEKEITLKDNTKIKLIDLLDIKLDIFDNIYQ